MQTRSCHSHRFCSPWLFPSPAVHICYWYLLEIGALSSCALQERCKALEASLAEHRDTHMASSQRQQDLEYELGRAWEELERVEATLQHQRAQHELTMQQQEMQLSQTRQVTHGNGCAVHAFCTSDSGPDQLP